MDPAASPSSSVPLGGGPGPALPSQDSQPAATMVNGANGVEGGGDGVSGSSSDAVTANQAPSAAPPTLPGRRCFVTVGATAAFASLLDEVASAGFLQSLAENGFTTLDVQCGPGLASFEERMAGISDQDRHGVEVASFAYTQAMDAYLHNCRGERGARLAGCVIAHGGTGTVGEVLHVGAPLIVVANTTLMDNHQLELVESLEEEGLVVQGRIGMLACALDQIADRITQGTLDDLPPYRAPPFPVPAADRVTLFDWMVLTCYPGELAAQMQTVDLGASEADLANPQQQQPLVNGNGPVVVANTQEDNAVPQLD